jgi:hypothetical protein
VQTLLEMWLAFGAITSGVMALGFRVMFEKLTLRHWGHVIAVVPLWPIGLMSALLIALGHPSASWTLERIAFGWIDRICDWYDLRRLRKLNGAVHRPMNLADCDDMIMDPNIFVQCGGTLPPNRPQGDAVIHVRKGVAQWVV